MDDGARREPERWREKLACHVGNVGLLTGGPLFVVDCDLYVPGAEDSCDRLRELGLPRLMITSLTGGGGWHLYYVTPVPIPSRPLDGFPGIDVKGEGGCVVVPPSVHPDSQRQYEWEYSYGPTDGGESDVAVD